MDDRELAQEFKTLHEENQLIIEILTTLGKLETEEEDEGESKERDTTKEDWEREGFCENCGQTIGENCKCTIDKINEKHNEQIEKTLKTGLKIKKKQTEEEDY